MIVSIIAKFMAPGLIGAAIGVAGVVGIQRATKPEIKLECPQPVCPEFKCPEGNMIDFEKVKNFKGTLRVEQHYHVTMDGDSLFREQLIRDMETKLRELKLARCK
jgi:hypothetical protein